MHILNKKALFDYEILDTYETGIVLTGSEVKSLRAQNASLKGTFIKVYNGEVILYNMHIGRYQPAGENGHIPDRNRKLLLHKNQIIKLIRASEEAGNTIVPLEVYTKGSLIKVKIAIARGKKKHEKRASIKERETKREAGRALKRAL